MCHVDYKLSLFVASADQYRLTCPGSWKLVQNKTCIRFTAPLNWYEATQKCKAEGGSLFDGGGNDYQSIAAQAILKQGRLRDGWFWVNAAYMQVEAGRVWTFNDGRFSIFRLTNFCIFD